MERVEYGGWKNNIRLANKEVELIITADVGPRIIRFGYIGKRNVFGEFADQKGRAGEKEWMIRGGHRFWIAPEAKPATYELDNVPVKFKAIPHGVRMMQEKGPLSGMAKTLEITLAPDRNEVSVTHILKNLGRKAASVSPWALTVMAKNGMAVIPLPAKIAHTDRLTHNQEWSLWGYTDFTDPRWTLGSRYIFFRQDPKRGPNKLGIAHREGWVAYQVDGFVFAKYFKRLDRAVYPDGNVNFETFANQDILELESLGPQVKLASGATVRHQEVWRLYRGVPACKTEADAARLSRRLAE
jgi:hypothetical protein